MSIYRVYLHTVPVAGADSKAKNPRKVAYTYPTIREEEDNSKPNPYEKQTFHFEGSLADCLASAKEYSVNALTAAGKTDLVNCFDQDYLLLRGSNDVAILELDPQRWSAGGPRKGGIGLKVNAAINKINAYFVDEDKEGLASYVKSLESEIWEGVKAKIVASSPSGAKRVSRMEGLRA